MKNLALIFAAAVCGISAFAEIKMPRIFSDNMLIQRAKPAKIWGTSAPNANIVVEFAGQKKSTKANANGKWSLALSPLKASAKPLEMSVYENGSVGATIGNIVVGELWILSGQSNMQFTLNQTDDAHVAIPRANYPNLRYFRMSQGAMAKTPQEDFNKQSRWELTTPENVGTQSAVGFYFGEKLLKDLNVPVGLVNTSMGGTLMACWTPAEYVDKVPYLKAYMDKYVKESAAYVKENGYEKKLATFNKNMEAYKAACKKAQEEKKPKPPYDWGKLSVPLPYTNFRNNEVPVFHWNAKVAPIAGISARGVLWYQGEQESGYATGNPQAVAAFDALYENMVKAWRDKWNDQNLWFVCAQLPSYGGGKLWALLRAQQLNAASNLKRSAIANTIDTGAKKDVHPRDKTIVGHRLANIAERDIYGKKSVSAHAPKFASAVFANDGAYVKFDVFGKKLVGKGDPRGFELRIDGKWLEGKPEIRKGYVFVANPQKDTKPDGVRYLWRPWAKPDVWLYSTGDLPAFPFEFTIKQF